MISLDAIIQMFTIDMDDCVVGPVSKVHCSDDLGIVVSLVRDNRHRLIASHSLTDLSHESPCSVGISPCGKAKIDQLPTLVDSPPEVAPPAINAHISLIYVPLQPTP